MKKFIFPLLAVISTNALSDNANYILDNVSGTATSKITGLTWQRCAVGSKYDSSPSGFDYYGTCNKYSYAKKMNWSDAMASYGNPSSCGVCEFQQQQKLTAYLMLEQTLLSKPFFLMIFQGFI